MIKGKINDFLQSSGRYPLVFNDLNKIVKRTAMTSALIVLLRILLDQKLRILVSSSELKRERKSSNREEVNRVFTGFLMFINIHNIVSKKPTAFPLN